MKIATLFVFMFLLNFISASCYSNQMNLNTASLSDLDKLTGIGPAKAQAIVDSRPFSSIADLIKVYGIGEATLEKIRVQGLACVDLEDSDSKEEHEEIKEEDSIKEDSSNETIHSTESLRLSEDLSSQGANENIINLNNKSKEERVIYESKNEKINKNLLLGFFIFIGGVIFLLIRK